MKRKVLSSIYTRFISLFLGAFLITIIITALFTHFTQLDNIKSFLNTTVEYRASSLKDLVNEQGISVQEASDYLSSADLKVSTAQDFDRIEISFSQEEVARMENGETIFKIHPNNRILILGVLELNGQRVFITPDLQNNPISQFKKFQRITFFLPILLGSIFIVFAVAMVVKPIKRISAASKQVAGGDFDVQVEVKGKDEIADLSKNFNLMVKELSAKEYLHKDFVSNVSHEFKTPITSLIGYAKLLRDRDLTAEEKNDYTNIIISESERLSNLSSNLLKLSELGNGVIGFKSERFELDEQIRDSILLLQNSWEEKNLELDLELDSVSFIGDKELLYQVWLNLISNAIKYSNAGGKLTITLKKNEAITVEVIDQGIGMTKSEQERIFSRFYKADKSRNTAGTGLGLTIVKEIVELHRATIEVESQVGRGSKFRVTLTS